MSKNIIYGLEIPKHNKTQARLTPMSFNIDHSEAFKRAVMSATSKNIDLLKKELKNIYTAVKHPATDHQIRLNLS